MIAVQAAVRHSPETGYFAALTYLGGRRFCLPISQKQWPKPAHPWGFEAALPDGAFVRGVPGGTLEQVVTCLDVLHALQALDIPVYNEARAIERSVDKAMTSFLLQRAGLAAPATWVAERCRRQAHAVVAAERWRVTQLVVKPLFGSQGKGLRACAGTDELPPPEAARACTTCSSSWAAPGHPHDWRVFVVNGRAIACMQRRGLPGSTTSARVGAPSRRTARRRARRSRGSGVAGARHGLLPAWT